VLSLDVRGLVTFLLSLLSRGSSYPLLVPPNREDLDGAFLRLRTVLERQAILLYRRIWSTFVLLV